MTYLIVKADGAIPLEEQVNKLLKQGWKLQGGPLVRHWSSTATWAQAMVKESSVEIKGQ